MSWDAPRVLDGNAPSPPSRNATCKFGSWNGLTSRPQTPLRTSRPTWGPAGSGARQTGLTGDQHDVVVYSRMGQRKAAFRVKQVYDTLY